MNRHLGTYSAVFLVVASMLGTGILTTTGIILSLVKAPSAALGIWIVGGGLALIGAWCYGELARLVPRSGGEATILRELFSPILGEVAGLTSFVVGFAACNAASALAFVDYLNEALPGRHFPPQLVACIALLLITSLHGLLGPMGLRIQTLLATAKFALLASLVLYGVFFSSPLAEQLQSGGPAAPAEFGGAWAQAMMLVMFAYSGWNAAIYVAGEIHEPARNIRRILILGTAIIVLLYIAINVILLSRLSAHDLEGVRPVIAVLIKHLFGPEAASLFSGLVAFALLSSLGVAAFLGPRVLAAMLDWINKEAHHKNTHTPVSPGLVWMQGALSILMVLTGSFVQILTIMGFLLGLFPILSILCLYRKTDVIDGWQLKLSRYVFAPLFIAVSTVILVLGAFNNPHEVALALALVTGFYLSRLAMRRIAKP